MKSLIARNKARNHRFNLVSDPNQIVGIDGGLYKVMDNEGKEYNAFWEYHAWHIWNGHHLVTLSNVDFCDNFVGYKRPAPVSASPGMQVIADEHLRNGGRWTAQHDDEHTGGELADAAACYAATTSRRNRFLSYVWPFEYGWWKPSSKNRIRELATAGALIVAEIERLQRLESTVKAPAPVLPCSACGASGDKSIRQNYTTPGGGEVIASWITPCDFCNGTGFLSEGAKNVE